MGSSQRVARRLRAADGARGGDAGGGAAVSMRRVNSSDVVRPPGSLPIRVSTLADLPDALGRLARLAAIADHLDPRTVGQLAAEHARTLMTLADVVGRRDTVRGTTAPALLGAATELRAHAANMADVRAATWAWRSSTPDDERPVRQQREIRRRLGRSRAWLRGALTDADLVVVIASLRPALRLAPAVRHAVTRYVQAGTWQGPQPAGVGRTQSPDVLVAAQTASESAARMTAWLPKPPPRPAWHHRSAREALDAQRMRREQRTRTPVIATISPTHAHVQPAR
jgi:hypothetical protein